MLATTVMMIILLSVYLDGLTSVPLVAAYSRSAPQETEPEELKENEPVTAQQGLSQRPQSPQPGDNQSPHLILGWG
jgi:hypothetical protein